jgi:biotin carboxyl carrier protein
VIHKRSMYLWNAPATSAGRTAKRDELFAIGCTQVFVKGFGDGGVAWIEGEALPAWARAQWSDAYAADFAPLDVILWGYPWPRDTDIDACVRALQARWSHTVVLNPETEWRWQNSNANPWNSLGEANAYAQGWMRSLKGACSKALGRVPSFWLSSCPTWGDLPYEGLMAECDGALPEHYFFERDMAGGEDMVEAHLRRAGTAKPCAPVLTCCREYDDQGVVDLAALALRDLPNPAGFSGWEAGNAAFQAAAMWRAYALLPEDKVEGQALPPGNEIIPHVLADGRPAVTIAFAGRTDTILGVDVADLGISVASATEAGVVLDQSVQGNAFGGWRVRAPEPAPVPEPPPPPLPPAPPAPAPQPQPEPEVSPMPRIRFKTIEDNQQGRAGTQVLSPYTGQVHYVTLEHGALHIRHYDGHDLGQAEAVEIAVIQITAHFANPGQVCVTLAGFTPDTRDSVLDTRLIDVKE